MTPLNRILLFKLTHKHRLCRSEKEYVSQVNFFRFQIHFIA